MAFQRGGSARGRAPRRRTNWAGIGDDLQTVAAAGATTVIAQPVGTANAAYQPTLVRIRGFLNVRPNFTDLDSATNNYVWAAGLYHLTTGVSAPTVMSTAGMEDERLLWCGGGSWHYAGTGSAVDGKAFTGVLCPVTVIDSKAMRKFQETDTIVFRIEAPGGALQFDYAFRFLYME